METKDATITEIKTFFEFESIKQVKDEWSILSDEEKQYFKKAVGEVVNA